MTCDCPQATNGVPIHRMGCPFRTDRSVVQIPDRLRTGEIVRIVDVELGVDRERMIDAIAERADGSGPVILYLKDPSWAEYSRPKPVD